MAKNPGHVKSGKGADFGSVEDDYRDRKGQQAANEARSEGLPGEEMRNVNKAGGGVEGQRLGGAHTGRSTSRPEEDLEKRKPYGSR